MRNFFITCLVAVFIAGCSDKDKLPEGVLPQKQMREVMWDMVRAGEFLNGFVFNRDSSLNKISESEKWYSKVYQLHKITKEDFDKSYAYYKDHPLLMKEMLDSLAKRQVFVKPVVNDSTAKRDSVNNIRNSTQKADSLRKSIDTLRKSVDTLRKKMIKKRKSLFKPV